MALIFKNAFAIALCIIFILYNAVDNNFLISFPLVNCVSSNKPGTGICKKDD